MLFALAKSGMKGKLTDYLTLFSGLTVSVAVMYLFLTLALNQEFITQNSVINSIQLVFLVGAVLLSVITFFYVLFAHSFLLSLRKKEFGTYLLLGVKRKQLKTIARVEIFLIGLLSTTLGILFGQVLAFGLVLLLTKQLHVTIDGFSPFYLPAVLFTLVYYGVALLLSSIWNHRKIMKTPALDFVYAHLQPNVIPQKKKRHIVTMSAGFLFLLIGYTALIFMEQLREIGLFAATICTTLGTYLLFAAFLPVIVQKMSNSSYLKNLNTFTFSQLRFRITELKSILATVTMLIALSAGAISGGFAFINNAKFVAEEGSIYDVRLFHPTEKENNILNTLPLVEKQIYHVKMDEDNFYYSTQELATYPPLIKDEITYDIRPAKGLTSTTVFELDQWGQQLLPSEWASALYHITPSAFKWTFLLSEEDYRTLELAEYEIVVGKTDNFLRYESEWKSLDEFQRSKYQIFGEGNYMYTSKYDTYQQYYAVASGTFFMGFFLGIAFLMMMASILMFKVLANAQSDIRRYEMLQKLGVRKKVLIRSLQKEIGLVFLFPAILGLLHVVIGMNLFSFILMNPYYQLWVSIVLFVGIYLIYYGLTVTMYKRIVLPKEKAGR